MRRILAMKMRVLATIPLVLLVAVLLGSGCTDLTSDGDGTSVVTESTLPGGPGSTFGSGPSSTGAVPSSSAGPTAGVSTTSAVTTSSEELLPNGNIRACGRITDVWVDGAGRHLRINYVDFLTGAEADEAAIADGAIAPGDHVPNDFYVRDNYATLREFDISTPVAITTSTRWVGGDMVPNAPCTWADFLSFWGPGPFPGNDDYMRNALWWIERDGNTVVKIDEQYIP